MFFFFIFTEKNSLGPLPNPQKRRNLKIYNFRYFYGMCENTRNLSLDLCNLIQHNKEQISSAEKKTIWPLNFLLMLIHKK